MNRLIEDRDFERVVDAARELGRIAEDYTGERRRWRLEAVLEDIIARLETRRPEDLAAVAVVALAEGMLAVFEVDAQDAAWADSDDGPAL